MPEWSTSAQCIVPTDPAAYTGWLVDAAIEHRRDQGEGASGVREPRRPIQPQHSGGAMLDLPRVDDAPPQYVWSV